MREAVNLFLGKGAVGVKGKQRGCRCCHRAHGQPWKTAVGCCISSLWISTSQIMCDKLQLGRKEESHPTGCKRNRERTRSSRGAWSSCSHSDCTLGCSFPAGPWYVQVILKWSENVPYGFKLWLLLRTPPTKDSYFHKEQSPTIVYSFPWRPSTIWIFWRKKKRSSSEFTCLHADPKLKWRKS